MSGSYTFEEQNEIIYVSFKAPCGDTIKDIAVITEPKSANPILHVLDPATNAYSAGLGLSGLAKILEHVKSRNKELD